MIYEGYKIMRSRTPYEMARPRRRVFTDYVRIPTPRHINVLMEILPDRIRDRSNLEPEPVPRNTRNLTQSSLSVRTCE